MHDTIKKKWADALRSGEYERTTGAMRTESGFCPLGVLCDVVKEEVGGTWQKWSTKTYEFLPHDQTTDAAMEVLPNTVRDYVGLDSRIPELSVPDATQERTLQRRVDFINDNDVADWETLADLIEEQL
jgi:hypothetical protein